MLLKALAGLSLAISLSQAAKADEWRYCIAPSAIDHKIYMTPVFASSAPSSSAESMLATLLERSHIRYDDIQCPRSDSESAALAMRQHTTNFNKEMGNQIIALRWKPKN
jgi:hypothetical protein